jgi:hypothetical protein
VGWEHRCEVVWVFMELPAEWVEIKLTLRREINVFKGFV